MSGHDTEPPPSDTVPFTAEDLARVEEDLEPEYRQAWHNYMAPLAPQGEE